MPNRMFASRPLRAGLLVGLFAITAWGASGRAPRQSLTPTDLLQRPRIEVAFVLDTTGSMAGLIEGAKQKIWSIANELASGQPRPEIEMALVGYRDRGDAYVTRVRDLSDDIDAVYGELQGLAAEGGGDTPESVNQALYEAVHDLSWSTGTGVYRVIFLVGDAPPHLDYPDDVPWSRTIAVARQRGIVVNTVQCGELAETSGIWAQIASSGGGEFAAIQQDGGMVAITTPVDDELAVLNREIAQTLVPYGAKSEQRELEAKRDRAASADAPAAASRLAFLSKLGGRLNAGRADLVDAIASGVESLAEVPAAELPPELQPLAPEERAVVVKQKLENRRRLQARIDELSVKRDAYVAAETKRRAESGEADGFDAKVLGAVRAQAGAAGITY